MTNGASPTARVVVCGIDDSSASRCAALAAVRLAAALDAHIVAVRVLDRDAEPEWNIAGSHRWKLQAAAAMADALFANVVADAQLPEPSVQIAYGAPAETLARVAGEHRAACLVVGASAQPGGIANMRRHVASVLRTTSPCPLIVVPERLDDMGLLFPSAWSRALICGIDGSVESLAAARAAGDIARPLGARVVLAHVCRPVTTLAGVLSSVPAAPVAMATALASNDRRRAAALLEEAREHVPADVRVEVEIVRGMPARELEDLAREQGCSLMAIGSSGRSALRSWLAGSASAALMRGARRPLMLVSPAAVGTVPWGEASRADLAGGPNGEFTPLDRIEPAATIGGTDVQRHGRRSA